MNDCGIRGECLRNSLKRILAAREGERGGGKNTMHRRKHVNSKRLVEKYWMEKKLGKHTRKREFIKYGGGKRMKGKDGGASFPAQCDPRI